MSALKIIFTILQVLSGIVLTVIVLMQSGKSSGLGAVAGGADTLFSKSKAKTWDEKLAKATKWFALAFVILTLILNFIK